MKLKPLFAVAALIALVAALLFWRRASVALEPTSVATTPVAVAKPLPAPTVPPAPTTRQDLGAVAPQPAPAPQPTPAAPSMTVATAQPEESLAPEVAATRRMIQAHAPLRTPEVAEPDSESNRRILQTMVTKAISRTEAKSAATAPTAVNR